MNRNGASALEKLRQAWMQASPSERRKFLKEVGPKRSATVPTDPPDELDTEDLNALCRWAVEKLPGVTLPQVEAKADEIFDWGRAKGIQRASWPATIRNALRQDFRNGSQTPQNGAQRTNGSRQTYGQQKMDNLKNAYHAVKARIETK